MIGDFVRGRGVFGAAILAVRRALGTAPLIFRIYFAPNNSKMINWPDRDVCICVDVTIFPLFQHRQQKSSAINRTVISAAVAVDCYSALLELNIFADNERRVFRGARALFTPYTQTRARNYIICKYFSLKLKAIRF